MDAKMKLAYDISTADVKFPFLLSLQLTSLRSKNIVNDICFKCLLKSLSVVK